MGQQLSGSVTKSSSSTSQPLKSVSEKESGAPKKEPMLQRSSSQPLNPPAKKKDPKESLYENLSYKADT